MLQTRALLESQFTSVKSDVVQDELHAELSYDRSIIDSL